VSKLAATVIGSGIFGLWQAFELSRRGHAVTLIDASAEPGAAASSRLAGAMLAPYCESEGAEPVITDLGLRGLELWQATAYPGVVSRGSLVLAAPRDQGELSRFARMTRGHQTVDAAAIAELEPDLAGRFPRGLFYAPEAHLAPRPALAWLLSELRRRGVELRSQRMDEITARHLRGDFIIDCRGLGARAELPELRGVRGEMLVLRAAEVTLSRPVRLLHPRFPLYVVPWGDGLFMVGATVIEREDAGPVTVRSALDLLGTAYALHPAIAEAEIVEMSAGVRPSLPDNVPKVIVQGNRLSVNGAYRHGFLLAPALADLVAAYLETGAVDDRVFVSEHQNA